MISQQQDYANTTSRLNNGNKYSSQQQFAYNEGDGGGGSGSGGEEDDLETTSATNQNGFSHSQSYSNIYNYYYQQQQQQQNNTQVCIFFIFVEGGSRDGWVMITHSLNYQSLSHSRIICYCADQIESNTSWIQFIALSQLCSKISFVYLLVFKSHFSLFKSDKVRENESI